VGKFYEVPDFQREYVWGRRREVVKLLEDLQVGFDARAEEGDYFLGSIVFWEEDAVRWLVDGQQRMTTLYILIAAIRDHVKATSDDASLGPYEIALSGINAESGSDETAHKLKLQSDETSVVLRTIADGAGDSLKPGRGGTRYRLVNAYTKCREFLRDEIGAELVEVDSFFKYVWRQTFLIEIETADLQAAYRIFQTLNDRGATLLASDLLKSLLFRLAGKSQVAQRTVKSEWKAILKAMDEAEEVNHVRFLRYFLMADYDTEGKILRADSLFEWLTEKGGNKALQKDLASPAEFATRVRKAAQAYAAFSKGRNPQGDRVMALEGIRYQGTGVKQHLCILLAARDLEPQAIAELAGALETLTLVFALSGEQWNLLEKALPDWTAQIRDMAKVDDQLASMTSFISSEIQPLLDSHARDLWKSLDDTEPDPQKLVACMIARMAQFIQEKAGLPGEWDTLVGKKMTLEHILPQALKPENLAEFGASSPEAGRGYVYRLGNLALMPWGKNSTMSKRTWELNPARPKEQPKKTAFANSDWLLFSSLAEDKTYGHGAITKTIEAYELPLAPVWNVEAFGQRQASLERIASDVWPRLPNRLATDS
jgi:hypothetical protein